MSLSPNSATSQQNSIQMALGMPQMVAGNPVKKELTMRQTMPDDSVLWLDPAAQDQSRPEKSAPVTTIPATIATANVTADGPFNDGDAFPPRNPEA